LVLLSCYGDDAGRAPFPDRSVGRGADAVNAAQRADAAVLPGFAACRIVEGRPPPRHDGRGGGAYVSASTIRGGGARRR
jgi:hypothetical protein